MRSAVSVSSGSSGIRQGRCQFGTVEEVVPDLGHIIGWSSFRRPTRVEG